MDAIKVNDRNGQKSDFKCAWDFSLFLYLFKKKKNFKLPHFYLKKYIFIRSANIVDYFSTIIIIQR